MSFFRGAHSLLSQPWSSAHPGAEAIGERESEPWRLPRPHVRLQCAALMTCPWIGLAVFRPHEARPCFREIGPQLNLGRF